MSAYHLPERTSVDLQKREIGMSNELARATQGLKLSEKRTLVLAMVKTDSVPLSDLVEAKSSGGWTVVITAMEYATVYGVDRDTAYSQLKSSAKSLIKKQVKSTIKTKNGIKEVQTCWVEQCVYSKMDAIVEITFTAKIAPHLLGLRGGFTNYKLNQVSGLRSIYSWRLFECLQSWRGTGLWEVSIEDFQKAMDAPESAKVGFGQLDRRILQPALKELREKYGMVIELEFEKVGKKIVTLIFKFKANEASLKL